MIYGDRSKHEIAWRGSRWVIAAWLIAGPLNPFALWVFATSDPRYNSRWIELAILAPGAAIGAAIALYGQRKEESTWGAAALQAGAAIGVTTTIICFLCAMATRCIPQDDWRMAMLQFWAMLLVIPYGFGTSIVAAIPIRLLAFRRVPLSRSR